MRVLVTGSRTWRDGLFVREKLQHCLDTARALGTDLTIVHGACKAGADSLADAWGRWQTTRSSDVRVTVEAHPALWEGPCRDTCQDNHRKPDARGWTVCPAAGYYRNEHMVHLGADLCLAFINDESKGATHCARYAESAGIPVSYFRTRTGSDALF
jgi:hypothetical protein